MISFQFSKDYSPMNSGHFDCSAASKRLTRKLFATMHYIVQRVMLQRLYRESEKNRLICFNL